MAQGLSQPRVKIVGADGETEATVLPGDDGTVLLVLDPEAKATLGNIQSSLESIALSLQLLLGGGDSLRS